MDGQAPMSGTQGLGELEVGQVVAERDLTLTRDSLVRYAGASDRKSVV